MRTLDGLANLSGLGPAHDQGLRGCRVADESEKEVREVGDGLITELKLMIMSVFKHFIQGWQV